MSSFEVSASWRGGVRGEGRVRTTVSDDPFSAPTALGGAGVGTNPEELLASAAATCFLITLGAVVERRGLPVERMEVSSVISVNAAFVVESIVHTPRIVLRAGSDSEETRRAVKDACVRAETMCLVTNAMRGNVHVEIDSRAFT